MMGSDVHLIVVGGPGSLAARGRSRLQRLEQLWTRFDVTSELATLNRRGDMAVSWETRLLVSRALRAWTITDGAFDPTVHDALVSAGYDRTFEAIDSSSAASAAHSVAVVPGPGGIEIDAVAGDVRLPPGVRIDAGGIGKGLAADVVAEELLADGASGVCINVGGDIRVAGHPPDGGRWRIAVEHPGSTEPLAVLALDAGGVATSSPLRRSWARGARRAHHIIDPRTARPAVTEVAAATVVASEAWQAEALAKAAVLAGSAAPAVALIRSVGLLGVVSDISGARTSVEKREAV